jgi:hypothetical protein
VHRTRKTKDLKEELGLHHFEGHHGQKQMQAFRQPHMPRPGLQSTGQGKWFEWNFAPVPRCSSLRGLGYAKSKQICIFGLI